MGSEFGKRQLLTRFEFGTILFVAWGLLVLYGVWKDLVHSEMSDVAAKIYSSINQNPDPTKFYCEQPGMRRKHIEEHDQYHFITGKNQGSNCKSRLEQHCYWKESIYHPSPEFLQAAREYEKFHAKCTLGVNLTELALDGKSGPEGCHYLVWKSLDGLGNQLISLVSAYVYALLTRRVLLIAHGEGISDLLCQPFMNSSWIMPEGLPESFIHGQILENRHGKFYDRVLNISSTGNNSNPFKSWQEMCKGDNNLSYCPKQLGVYLGNYYSVQDNRFFCSSEQELLASVPWIFFHSNEYSIPGFYFLPSFRKILNRLFPDRAVFLHAGRYLLNPEDDVWNRITRFYKIYLSHANSTLGIQVRAWGNEHKPIISMHILKCATEAGVLPMLITQPDETPRSNSTSGSMAVLLASLRPEYARNLTEFYLSYPNVDGKEISVITPSSEGKQIFAKHDHDIKALADMWLLSFTDDLIISPRSTFGYVAHGLAGITPLVFKHFAVFNSIPTPPCYRSNLPGPCFIDPPEDMTCPLDTARGIPNAGIGNANSTVPEVRKCVLQWGVGVIE